MTGLVIIGVIAIVLMFFIGNELSVLNATMRSINFEIVEMAKKISYSGLVNYNKY